MRAPVVGAVFGGLGLPAAVGLSIAALELVAIAGTCLLFFACRGPGNALITRAGPRIGLTNERVARVGSLIEARGRSMLLIGRGTPGLRTITAIAAGTSGIPGRRALPPMIIGASVFVQLHLALGALLGPFARDLFDEAKSVATIGDRRQPVVRLRSGQSFRTASRGSGGIRKLKFVNDAPRLSKKRPASSGAR